MKDPLPDRPTDRVAVGVAIATAGVLLNRTADMAAIGFAARFLMGFGGTAVVQGLIKLWLASRASPPEG